MQTAMPMYVYNQRSKTGRVHLFKAHWKSDILNPSMTGSDQQTEHWIYFQCVQNPYRWVTGPHKIRDFGQDYVVTDELPEGMKLCGSCQRFLDEGGQIQYPSEDVLRTGSPSRGDTVRVRHNMEYCEHCEKGDECCFSTGIGGETTAGHGELDDYGYWEFPCPNGSRKARALDRSWAEKEAKNKEDIRSLCKNIGYGRVMQIAAELWAEEDPVGALTLGPALGVLNKS